MKCAVIGAHGFLGRTLCRVLAAEPGCVVLPMGRDFQQQLTLDESTDVIFLVAAVLARADRGAFDYAANYEVVRQVMNLCQDRGTCPRIVYASTVAVYGDRPGESLNVLSPVSLETGDYARSKIAGECLVRCWPKWTIVRFPSLYGPGMHPNYFLARMYSGNRPVVRDPYRVQHYVFVDDAASGLVNVARDQDNHTYLACGARATNKEIADVMVSVGCGVTLDYSNVRHYGNEYESNFATTGPASPHEIVHTLFARGIA